MNAMIQKLLNFRWIRRLLGLNSKLRCTAAWGCDNYADCILHIRGRREPVKATRKVYCCTGCKIDMLQNAKYMSYLNIEYLKE